MNVGQDLGPYRILAKLGEGGPPPLLPSISTSYGEPRRSHDRTGL
jgi:hypothetical protein